MGKPPASSRKLTNTSNPSSSETEQQNKPRPTKKRQLSPPTFIDDPQVQATTNEQDPCTFDPSMMDTEDFMSMNWQDDIFQSSTFDGPSADIQLTAANLFDLTFDFMGDSTPPLASNNQFVFGDDSVDLSRTPTRDPTFEPLQHFPSHSSQSTKCASPRPGKPSPKLCTHQMDFSRTSLPSPIPQSNACIDQVLINNKAAIENAYSLLACPCSHNPHFALSLALICNKILGMYETVIKASPPSSKSSSTGSPGSDTNSIAPIPITVGAYKMDAEDEERMRIQIVVNELRKVKGLVDKYASKYVTGGAEVKGDAGEGIYSALEMFLRSKLATTLQDLLTRLEC